MRLRAFPFGEDVEKFLEQQKLVFVIEQNRDAQMRSLLTLETRVPKEKLRSLLHYSGLPISSEFIVKGVLAEIEPKKRKPEVVVAGGVA
jgi:2-oxoglutarate ferredoxin oxidoreductase subunit alpha